MNIPLVDFPQTIGGAIQLQTVLSRQVILSPLICPPKIVVGLDVHFNDKAELAYAVAIVWDVSRKMMVECVSETAPISFPYISGLLAFRELPAILACLKKVPIQPDIVLCDGHGIAHSRGLGLASHLGVLLDLPVMGCAKNRYVGKHAEVGPNVGNSEPLIYKEQTVGFVYRSKRRTRPLYLSPGHRMALADCIPVTQTLLTLYRIPEPLRLAHAAALQLRKTSI